MIALALVALVAAQAGAVGDVAEVGGAWCDRALPLAVAAPAGGPDAMLAFEELTMAMPQQAAPVVARARDLAGEEGVERSMSVLRFAVVDACAQRHAGDLEDRTALAASAAALMTDPRFEGVRKGDGTLDRVMHKIWLFLVSLVESEGMQEYASASRVLFLSLIALGAVAITVVTLRKRRAAQAGTGAGAGDARIEATRKEAYAALRARADALLAQGDARGALRAGDAALLARLGELDTRTVTPARTHREIVARLPGPLGDVVRGPFATFDALFFGRATLGSEDARAYLTSVDAAEATLARGASGGTSSASSAGAARARAA